MNKLNLTLRFIKLYIYIYHDYIISHYLYYKRRNIIYYNNISHNMKYKLYEILPFFHNYLT